MELDFNILQNVTSLEQLCEELAKLQKKVKYIINGNLDFENIRVKGIIAENITVDQLSALSTNLGKVVAGILVGAYIATADGTYPRIELSSVGNLLSAFFDATHALNIIPSLGGTPGLQFASPSGQTNIIKGAFFTVASELDILIRSLTNVRLEAGVGGSGKVDITSPGGIVINSVSIQAGTKVYYVSDTLGGPTNRKLTFTDGILTKET